MTTSRKIALACVTSAIAIALSIPMYSGALKAYAAAGLSGDVDVNIINPVPGGGTLDVDVFTPGGLAPTSLVVGVEASINLLLNGNPALPDLTAVDFALNGTLDEPGRTVLNATDVNAGTQSGGTGALTTWEGALELASGNFAPVAVRGVLVPTLVSASVARAFATVEGYYSTPGRAPGNVIGFDDYDSITINTEVFDSADVDDNGDNKPDHDGLIAVSAGQIVGTGPSGGPMVTVWDDIGSARGGGTTSVEAQLLTSLGLVDVSVTSQSAATIQALAQLAGAYNSYDQARLVMSVATVPTDLLNDVPPVDPLAEFLAPQGPPPQGLFALANVLLRDPASAANPWVNINDITGAELDITISGAGIAAAIAAVPPGSTVNVYEYDTSVVEQPSGALLDTADGNGWDVNATAALSRAVTAPGDDTVAASVGKGSSIIGSNIVPLVTAAPIAGGGGSSSGICFIATAAYGTPLADDIQVLRAVRDSYMLNTAVGSAFVDTYYRFSPPIADAVADSALLRSVVRTLLTPVVIVSSFAMAMPGLSLALMLLAGVFAVAHLRRRIMQA